MYVRRGDIVEERMLRVQIPAHMIKPRPGLSLGEELSIESTYEWDQNETVGLPARVGEAPGIGRAPAAKSHLNSKSISQPLPHDVCGRPPWSLVGPAHIGRSCAASRQPPPAPFCLPPPFPSRRRLVPSACSTTASNIKYDICTARNRRSSAQSAFQPPPPLPRRRRRRRRLHAGIKSTWQ